MTDSPQPKSKCTHTILENDIHRFVLADSSIASYDAYIQELDNVYRLRTPDSAPLRALFDGGTVNLPISYAMKRGKELLNKYPNVGITRTAILTDNLFEIHLVDSFIRMMRLPNMYLRFFALSRRDEAMNWLLQND